MLWIISTSPLTPTSERNAASERVCPVRSLLIGRDKNVCAQSTNKGVNQRSKDVIQTQLQRPESSIVVALTWYASKYKIHKLRQRYVLNLSGGVCVLRIYSHAR